MKAGPRANHYHETAEIEGKVQCVLLTTIVEEYDIGYDCGLNCLRTCLSRVLCKLDWGEFTSADPAPIPFRTDAPMKLPYVVALARQMHETKQINVEKIYTGRLPNAVEIGTLVSSSQTNATKSWKESMFATPILTK